MRLLDLKRTTLIHLCIYCSIFGFGVSTPGERLSLIETNAISPRESTENVIAYENLPFNERFEDPSTFLPCIKCNSTKEGKGKECFQIKNALFLSNCRKSVGQCYTAIIDGNVHRGCVGDELFPDEKSIGKTSIPIKLCNNNRLCNQDEIVDTCIGCRGEKCDNPTVAMERPCSLESSQGQGCYLKKLSEKSYERGCIRDLPSSEQQQCQLPHSIECQSCPDRNCNLKISSDQRCYYCNGTKDRDCFLEKSQKVEITCIGYSSTCLVGVDNEGYAHRQCSTNTDKDKLRFPKGFELCYGNLCNNKLFPNWTKCFRCAEERSCNHPSADLLPELCRVNQDPCFIFGKEDGEFHRGCMSDMSKGRKKCEEYKEECFVCNTTECNYYQNFQLKKLYGDSSSSPIAVSFGTFSMMMIGTLLGNCHFL